MHWKLSLAAVLMGAASMAGASTATNQMCVRSWSVKDLRPHDAIKAAATWANYAHYDVDAVDEGHGARSTGGSLPNGSWWKLESTAREVDYISLSGVPLAPGVTQGYGGGWIALTPYSQYSFEMVARISGYSTNGHTVYSGVGLQVVGPDDQDLLPGMHFSSFSFGLREQTTGGSFSATKTQTMTFTNDSAATMYFQPFLSRNMSIFSPTTPYSGL